MDLVIKDMPFGVKPDVPAPDSAIYKHLGEIGLRMLIAHHYDLLVESDIKAMFPPKGEPLEQAKKRSADFFIQRFGGPDYYNQTRGNPRLVSRHTPFKITPHGRIVWLECYRTALLATDLPEDLLLSYWNFLHEFSNWMVNSNE